MKLLKWKIIVNFYEKEEKRKFKSMGVFFSLFFHLGLPGIA